ncbi:hypothetical protein HKX48_007290 [Thoreauomyces humboldtii]|nr:hypothetical protein HKX48_007290 [Thoreauomyces humboldtii]
MVFQTLAYKLELAFSRDLAWVKSKKYETAVWGYCPVERPSTPYPTRYCWAFERPCFDYSQSPSADRSSILWQLFIQILGWLATALALVQTFLHRSFQQPAIYSGVAAVATVIGCYLTYAFSECTLDLIKKTENDKTARLGPPIFLSGAATVLILVAAATYWIEFKIVQKLQVVLLLKKKDDKGHGGHGAHSTHAAAVVVHDTHHV